MQSRSRFAVIKVSPCLRDIILKTHRLFIDMESHYVTDHHHIVQCYKCQGVVHKSDSKICSLYSTNRFVCLCCSGDHKSGQCTFKTSTNKHECANCKNGKTLDIRLKAKGHTSTSQQCLLIQRELKHIINQTQ